MRPSRKHQDPALAQLQAALTAPASADELAGEAGALGTFRAVSWRQEARWRRPAILAGKLGVATVAGVLGLSGVATAAYTGSLPSTLQDVAHKTIKAPAAHPPTQAVGPDATGSAAYGLCQAFAKTQEHPGKPTAAPTHEPQGQENGQENGQSHGKGKGLGKNHGSSPQATQATQAPGADRGQSKEKSVAYRNLVRAAGGEDKVAAYCASVPKPSGEPESSEAPEDHGKPTSLPTHPAGDSHGTPGHGRPTGLPAPAQSHPTGEPSPHPTGSAGS